MSVCGEISSGDGIISKVTHKSTIAWVKGGAVDRSERRQESDKSAKCRGNHGLQKTRADG